MKVSSSASILLLTFVQCVVYALHTQSGCPIVRLTNGKVRARSKGKIIRFSCYEGYTLIGNKYSTCNRGHWDTPTPVCVSTKCPTPPTPERALMARKYDGAILIYFCEPGFTLIGPAEIYCDGKQWNGTAPHCRDTTATAPTQCDFEKTDLCWWEQDPLHDFDWQRHNFETPSSHIGTGPTHDHTLGPGNEGYYLYIEASGRLVNDTARIISPIYNASYTESGCFSFWYHMYGATIGTLNVYFKAETEALPQLMFSKEGNQGNQWFQGIFSLPKCEKGFQIIIEGVRGSSYVSDIAIDDVAILQGDKCSLTKTNDSGDVTTARVTESNEDQVEVVNAQLSCRGRCKNSYATMFTPDGSSLADACQCTLDCAEYSSCCPDYAEYCVLGFTDDSATEVTEATTAHHDTVATVRLAKKTTVTDVAIVRTDFYDRKGMSINPKDDIDPVTLKPSTTTTMRPKVTPKSTTPRTQRTTRTTRRTTQPIRTTTIIRTKETPFMQTTAAGGYVRVEQPADKDARVQDLEKLHRNTAKFSSTGIIGIVIGILTGVSISTMVIFIILRRRKTFKRGANESALSEDSDVRFLTSDEILDFTLARPSDNDET